MLEFLPVEIVKYIFNIYLDYENVVPILSEIINFTFDITPHITEETIDDLDGNFTERKYLDGIIKYVKSIIYPDEVNIYNYKNGLLHGEYLELIIIKLNIIVHT